MIINNKHHSNKQEIWFLYRHPVNFFSMNDCDCCTMNNDSCGDTITVYAKIDFGSVEKLSFQAVGCSLLFASASIAISNCSNSLKSAFFDAYVAFQQHINKQILDDRFTLFDDINNYRKKCVLLPWQAFAKIILS